MTSSPQKTLLCITSYEKGQEFIRECKRQRAYVILHPNTSAYQDPEIVMRLDKRHHVGSVIASESPDRVNFLLDEYTQRFVNDFLATLPPGETRPPSSTSV